MSHTKVEKIMGRCGYCYYDNREVRLIQLHSSPQDKEWQYPIWICDSCREYLIGFFRYAPRLRKE